MMLHQSSVRSADCSNKVCSGRRALGQHHPPEPGVVERRRLDGRRGGPGRGHVPAPHEPLGQGAARRGRHRTHRLGLRPAPAGVVLMRAVAVALVGAVALALVAGSASCILFTGTSDGYAGGGRSAQLGLHVVVAVPRADVLLRGRRRCAQRGLRRRAAPRATRCARWRRTAATGASVSCRAARSRWRVDGARFVTTWAPSPSARNSARTAVVSRPLKRVRVRSLRTSALGVVLAGRVAPAAPLRHERRGVALRRSDLCPRDRGPRTKWWPAARPRATPRPSRSASTPSLARAISASASFCRTARCPSTATTSWATACSSASATSSTAPTAWRCSAASTRCGTLPERSEVRAALAGEHAERCNHSTLGNLEISTRPRPSRSRAAGSPSSTARQLAPALDALYASRRQLLKLTGFVLALAIVLWIWMGRQMVRPVESLRDELLSRARAAAPRADLKVARSNEMATSRRRSTC